MSSKAVLGIWTAASRRKVRIRRQPSNDSRRGRGCRSRGSATRCSTRSSSRWAERTSGTRRRRADDKEFAQVRRSTGAREAAPGALPGRVPEPRGADARPRADLVAILLTGIPAGIIPGFQNSPAPTHADMLRLNVAIPPRREPELARASLGGDLAGFPNGRRLADDVVTIELKAIAGPRTRSSTRPTRPTRRPSRSRHPGLTPGRPLPVDVPVRRPAARRVQPAVEPRPRAPARGLHGPLAPRVRGPGHRRRRRRAHRARAGRTCSAPRSRSARPGRTTGAATRTSSRANAGWAASRPTPPSSTACVRAPTRSGAADVPRTRDVTITGGAIAEVDWRA